jgi:hypothetical protein
LYGPSITHKDDHFAKNWMKNKKVQILEFGICWPLSVQFIFNTVRDRGNPLPFNRKLYPNMPNFGI